MRHDRLLKFIEKEGLLNQSVSELPSDLRVVCDDSKLAKKLSEKLGLTLFSISRELLPSIVLLFDSVKFSEIPIKRWIDAGSFPVEASEKRVCVAVYNPFDLEWKNFLEFEIGCRVDVVIAPYSQVRAVLAARDRSDFNFELPDETKTEIIKEEAPVDSNNHEAAPIVKLVDKILRESIERHASDIHISPEQDGSPVRIRVDGLLQLLLTIPPGFHPAVVSRIKLLGGMDIAEKRRPQDGRLRIKAGEIMKDLRLSTVPTQYGENLVIRVLGGEFQSINFDSLGMPAEVQARLKKMLSGTSRVVLVTGPTGSGKSSTLYAALQYKNDGSHNIITIEDPVEYRLQGITQIQVNSKVELGFAEGLRSVLRQDPDVIMVGEIRDGETATIAMQSAQTGHLVLSTLHTNSAPAAITRLIDMGVPGFVVAASVGGILAQRLVRKLCTCNKPSDCDLCHGTGYAGRTAVYSVLEITDQIRDAIHNNVPEHEIERLARAEGYISLQEAGAELLKNGVTSKEEILRVLGDLPKLEAKEEVLKKSLKKTKLLLVEDDPDTRWIMTEVFKEQLFDVTTADNGLQGVERVYEDQPDVIVADLMMPKMSGLELVQKLKSDPRTNKIPILILTAAGSDENEISSFGHGVDDFVSKGSDIKILLARVQRLVSMRAQ